jgi:hypothetical protein
MARAWMRLRKQQRKSARLGRRSRLGRQRQRRREKSRIAQTLKVTLELGLQGASKDAPLFVARRMTQTVSALSHFTQLKHCLTG